MIMFRNNPSFAAMLLWFLSAPAYAGTAHCVADIPANTFLDFAASKSNNFEAERQAGNGSCLIQGATAVASGGQQQEVKCRFVILSKSLKNGWKLDDVEFFQNQDQTLFSWSQGTDFTLSANAGNSSMVTLVSVKMCVGDAAATDWHGAF